MRSRVRSQKLFSTDSKSEVKSQKSLFTCCFDFREIREKNRGYVLLIVLILSVIIALIGAGLAVMNQQGFLSTKANTLFNKLQKAAHYGINESIRRIVEGEGICEEGIISETLEVNGAQVKVSTSRKGFNLCSLRAEATLGKARQVIVATAQGFYGIGTYTTKGSVSASISGGLISGCDLVNNCTIPGFITQGDVEVRSPTGTCGNLGSTGVYGTPPTKPEVPFLDLVSLAFNADCFACLLGIFEREESYTGYPMGLGSNPLWKDENGIARRDIHFDGSVDSCERCPDFRIVDEAKRIIGYVRIDFPVFSEIPDYENCITTSGTTIDLSTVNKKCIILTNTSTSSFTIRNKPPQGLAPVYVYRNVNRNVTLYLQNTGNFNFINNLGSITISSSNSANFSVYNKATVNVTSSLHLARIVANGDININTSQTVSSSTLITANTVRAGASSFNISDTTVFARRLDFGSNRGINIQGGMLYLYATADEERTNRRILDQGCQWGNDPNECAWYGVNLYSPVTIGTENSPALIILVNSATYVGSTDTLNINAVLFGEGVTYMEYRQVDTQNYEGILVRNFPGDETLEIRITGDLRLNFNYRIINTLHNKFWFVKRFGCIKEYPSTRAQVVWTYHSSY